MSLELQKPPEVKGYGQAEGFQTFKETQSLGEASLAREDSGRE